MDAIFLKENVYVLIKDHKPVDKEVMNKDTSFIVGSSFKNENYLYGGRVYLKMYSDGTMYFHVDGILIHIYEDSKLSNEIPIASGVAFLNQIANLGVDTFLDNYKKVLSDYKKDLEKQSLQISQDLSLHEDDKQRSLLNKLEVLLQKISGLLFTVSIHLSVGIDNHTYEELYSNILNQFY